MNCFNERLNNSLSELKANMRLTARTMSQQQGEQSCSEDGATELLNEPLLGLLLGNLLEVAKVGGSCSASGHSLAGAGEDNVEVHAVDTS